MNVYRKDFDMQDYQENDPFEREFFIKYLETIGADSADDREVKATPDVIFKMNGKLIRAELEARRAFSSHLWNKSLPVYVAIKYYYITDTTDFWHIILDMSELHSGKITRFCRLKVADIIDRRKVNRTCWNYRKKCYENELFYDVPRSCLEQITLKNPIYLSNWKG